MDWNLAIVGSELILLATIALLILTDLVFRRRESTLLPETLTLLGLAAAFAYLAGQWGEPARAAFGGRLLLDPLALYLRGLFLFIGAGTVLISIPYLKREGLERVEYLILLLFAVLGMMVLAGSADLLTLFLGLELLSMALYVLAGFHRQQERSVEAALKYFLLGSFASALLLLGIALLWGTGGSLHLRELASAWTGGTVIHPLMAKAGFYLVIVGLVFKVGVVPFHFWTADVYEGSPAPVAAFMATGTKAAALAALARLLLVGMGSMRAEWLPVIWWLALLTMVVGNFMAIAQSNIKRLLAFSSVAHAGYLMLAFVAGTELSMRALLFYLAAYTVMNLGAFAVVALVGGKGERYQSIYDYSGLAKRQPWMAAFMAIFLLSLAGIPPAIGFAGKFLVFSELLRGGHLGLTLVAVLLSLVSAYYYLRVIYLMYMKDEGEETPSVTAVTWPAGILLVVSLAIVILGGILPGGLLDLAEGAARIF